MRAYSEKLYKVDSSGNVARSGISFDIQAWYLDLTLAEHGDLYVNENNGRDGRATEAVFNGATGQAFFRWWADMVTPAWPLTWGATRAAPTPFWPWLPGGRP